MRRRAYEKRKRREEVHIIGVRNEIRSALGGELIDQEDLHGPSPAAGQDDEEELQAFKYRMQDVVDWDEDLTTNK